jgi:hypothetical protein
MKISFDSDATAKTVGLANDHAMQVNAPRLGSHSQTGLG